MRLVKPEHLLILGYLIALGFSIVARELGKSLYWLGVIILTVGLLLMKG